jgi:hypothetical protein
VDASAYMAELRAEVELLRAELLEAKEASVTAQGGGLLAYMQSLGRENVAGLTAQISQACNGCNGCNERHRSRRLAPLTRLVPRGTSPRLVIYRYIPLPTDTYRYLPLPTVTYRYLPSPTVNYRYMRPSGHFGASPAAVGEVATTFTPPLSRHHLLTTIWLPPIVARARCDAVAHQDGECYTRYTQYTRHTRHTRHTRTPGTPSTPGTSGTPRYKTCSMRCGRSLRTYSATRAWEGSSSWRPPDSS